MLGQATLLLYNLVYAYGQMGYFSPVIQGVLKWSKLNRPSLPCTESQGRVGVLIKD